MKVKRGRGQPAGTRHKPELYAGILEVLKKQDPGKGLNATEISNTLNQNRDTVCLYLDDLVKQKKIRCKRVSHWALYWIDERVSLGQAPSTAGVSVRGGAP